MSEIKFIDNHIHGAFGINFNYSSYDETKFLLKELYKKNVRGICPTLVGDTDKNIQKQLALFQRIRKEQLDDVQNEALVLGIHLEGTFLSPLKAGIQDKSVFKKPTITNFENLAGEFKDIIKIVTIAPEEDERLIDYLNDKNIIAQAGHSVGENLKGCVGLTHIFNAMNQIHHRNGSIALQALIEDEIYCEVIADLVHLSNDALKLVFKIKPKEKILLVSDSLPCSNYDKNIVFCAREINSLGKDCNGVLAGSNKTLDEICFNLIQNNILSKEDIKQMAFENQIKYLKLTSREQCILNR